MAQPAAQYHLQSFIVRQSTASQRPRPLKIALQRQEQVLVCGEDQEDEEDHLIGASQARRGIAE